MTKTNNTKLILRKEVLEGLKSRQNFKVSTGKRFLIDNEKKFSKWFNYEKFESKWKLRQILDDEIVIEFDMPKSWEGTLEEFRLLVSFPAISSVGHKLQEDNIFFQIWEHCGKSPHLHIHNLPCKAFDKKKRKLFKESFIKHYVPEQYKDYTDFSLCGCHLVAIEWAEHWKGCYGVKKLIHKWEDFK